MNISCSTQLILSDLPEVGPMLLWLPEAMVSESGTCSVYPLGRSWQEEGDAWVQHVTTEGLFGPGNMIRIDDNTLECAGIRIQVGSPVTWTTHVTCGQEELDFRIRLTNVGEQTIRKVGGAICLKFLEADWWCDEQVFVRSEGKVQTLAQLGRDAGPDNGFQSYLVRGQTFDNPFNREFWGVNDHRLDLPSMVSVHRSSGVSLEVAADNAYLLRSNPGNPCTDLMLGFGDIEPGATAEADGRVRIHRKDPEEILAI